MWMYGFHIYAVTHIIIIFVLYFLILIEYWTIYKTFELVQIKLIKAFQIMKVQFAEVQSLN